MPSIVAVEEFLSGASVRPLGTSDALAPQEKSNGAGEKSNGAGEKSNGLGRKIVYKTGVGARASANPRAIEPMATCGRRTDESAEE